MHIYIHIYLSIYRSIDPFIYLSIYLSICVHLAAVGLGAVAVAHHQATVAIWSRTLNISSPFTQISTQIYS